MKIKVNGETDLQSVITVDHIVITNTRRIQRKFPFFRKISNRFEVRINDSDEDLEEGRIYFHGIGLSLQNYNTGMTIIPTRKDLKRILRFGKIGLTLLDEDGNSQSHLSCETIHITIWDSEWMWEIPNRKIEILNAPYRKEGDSFV